MWTTISLVSTFSDNGQSYYNYISLLKKEQKMIKHIVFFKLSEEGMNQQDLIVEKLNNLKSEIGFD